MDDDAADQQTLMRRAIDAGDELLDLLKVLPYARHVIAAYRWNQHRRLKQFLQALNAPIDEMNAEDRRRFDEYINSNVGRELLADFADEAVRSRSPTAIAALALLYGQQTDAAFKGTVAQSLEGISELSIDVLLLLWRSRSSLATSPDKAVASVSDAEVRSVPTLSAANWDADTWVTAIDDLQSRGLLARDLSAGGRLPDEKWAWHRWVRFTEFTDAAVSLFLRGRSYLRPASNPLGL